MQTDATELDTADDATLRKVRAWLHTLDDYVQSAYVTTVVDKSTPVAMFLRLNAESLRTVLKRQQIDAKFRIKYGDPLEDGEVFSDYTGVYVPPELLNDSERQPKDVNNSINTSQVGQSRAWESMTPSERTKTALSLLHELGAVTGTSTCVRDAVAVNLKEGQDLPATYQGYVLSPRQDFIYVRPDENYEPLVQGKTFEEAVTALSMSLDHYVSHVSEDSITYSTVANAGTRQLSLEENEWQARLVNVSLLEGKVTEPDAKQAKALASRAATWIAKNMFDEFIGNVARPIALYSARGTYKHEEGHKLARHITTNGARGYYKASGGKGVWHQTFTPAVREQVMKALRDAAEKLRKDPVVVATLPKKWQGTDENTIPVVQQFENGDDCIACWNVPHVGVHTGVVRIHTLPQGGRRRTATVILREDVLHKGGRGGYRKGTVLSIPMVTDSVEHSPYFNSLHELDDDKAQALRTCPQILQDTFSVTQRGNDVVLENQHGRWLFEGEGIENVMRTVYRIGEREFNLNGDNQIEEVRAQLDPALEEMADRYGRATDYYGDSGVVYGAQTATAGTLPEYGVTIHNAQGTSTAMLDRAKQNGWLPAQGNYLTHPDSSHKMAGHHGAVVVFKDVAGYCEYLKTLQK